MTTTAEIAGGRILVRPTIAEILAVAAIPGATWDRNSKAYSLRATSANAHLLLQRVATLHRVEALSALETPTPSNPSTPALPAQEPPTPRQQRPVSNGTAIETARKASVAIPSALRVQPWKHQVEGYDFAMGALRTYHAALLAASMGTGKTLVATMLALGLDARMVLVVCPLRVIGSWRDQLAQYIAERFVVAPLIDKIGTTARRVELAQEKLALAQVRKCRFFTVVNYDVIWRGAMAQWLLGQHWDLAIWDESHRIRGVGGRASMFAKRLLPHSTYRVLASGTPLAHSQLDIFGQFRAAAPEVFGRTYAAFKAKYAVMGGPSRTWVVGYKNQADLEDRMAPLTWRCTKREALPDLPEQIDVEYSTELSPEAARIYRQLEQDMITQIQGHLLTAANCLTKVLRLQQLTGGSLKTDDGASHVVDDGKRKLLVDTLEDLGAEPVVIFCRFRSDIDAAHEACSEALPKRKDKRGHELPVSLELSGTRDELERWQGGEAQALVVQMQAGSVGISLVRANVAIYYSLSTNLVEYDQSRSRLHRPGQKRPCTYVYITCQGTIDQKILAALRARQDVIEAIMQSIAEKAKAAGRR